MRTSPAILTFFLISLSCSAEEIPIVTGVELQPFAAQVARLGQALEMLGEPLPAADTLQLTIPYSAFDVRSIFGVRRSPRS